jgi:hypothetical protein
VISRIVVYISRTLSDCLSLYMLYVSGARILTAWASIFGMLADRAAVLRLQSLCGRVSVMQLSTCLVS